MKADYIFPSVEQSFHLVRTSILHEVLDVLADPWNLSILRALFHSAKRFDELIETLGVSRAALSVRLNFLFEQGCLDKEAYGSSGKRFAYSITAKGYALKDVFLSLDQWNQEWLGRQQGPELGLSCQHCAKPLTIVLRCQQCAQALKASQVKPLFMRGPLPAVVDARDYRRTRSAPSSEKVEDPLQISAEVWLRDRWSSLLIGSMLFGLRRYGDLQNCLDIAPNILANRLEILQAAHMVKRQDDGGYLLLSRGIGLYPAIMAMREWAMQWLPNHHLREQGWDLLHIPCSSWLSLEACCVHCGHKAS